MHPVCRRMWLLPALVCLMFCLSAAADPAVIRADQPPPYFAEKPLLEVYFIAMGEGDAIFLRSGPETMLIDGGGIAQVKFLKGFLDAHDVWGVTDLLNTHWHEDHIGGMLALLREGFPAERFFSPYPMGFCNEYYNKLYPLLERGGIAFETVGHGDRIPLGAAMLHVFRDTQEGHSTNAKSLVLKVVCGQRTLLLMADAAGFGEHELMHTVGEGLKADVIKVSHHGSMRSVSGFMETVRPEVAIVTNSCKRVPDMEKQLRNMRIPAYFTGSRDVYMATDGNVWYIYQGETGVNSKIPLAKAAPTVYNSAHPDRQ